MVLCPGCTLYSTRGCTRGWYRVVHEGGTGWYTGVVQGGTGCTLYSPRSTMHGGLTDAASRMIALSFPGMTTRSFRPFLEGKSNAAELYRPFVSSGLANFRLVVQELNGTQWKYICCQGQCPNRPSTAPNATNAAGFIEMLIDIIADPYDMASKHIERRDVVDILRPLLPADYAQGC